MDVIGRKKVLVAMSGGVDSSVTAALLLEQGYEVVGVTMQIWDPKIEVVGEEYVGCCSIYAVNDARRVADRLGIPYYVLNFRELFERKVIDYFTEEYLRGRTPNPCIACNRYIKFDALLKKALSLGMDYMATGHYARVVYKKDIGKYGLFRGVDRKKDQTYVLYNLTQEMLKRLLLPLGEYTKEQVRELARKYNLVTADKPESQEICFVPDNDYRKFLKERRGEDIKPGNFVDVNGRVLGQHQGYPYYTIGQRKGLGLALGKPYYVVDIRPETNEVVVGEAAEIFSPGLVASDLNFLWFDEIPERFEAQAQIRYNAKPQPAVVERIGENQVRVTFNEPQRAITPGQAVVFYRGDELLGGGTIEKRL
ncbi:UDP-N-acetylmuramate--L-alanine ligase [Carboxydothermus islandicus]|uniref:tRNA-specific 2-thiouridylase MnmA n=1 Tax=Carboxydothermus islandicus TaxID=661089 RepID=A0A1L8CZH7_9THEO|nr:tRNA 2-thiouridine(34) synthase MnmA [Carboxydothermus islandicus]GAV24297.1 UDP-N-acetylmuramate--L-alanine ligase [Carboxydothermus islandicus]